MADIDAPLPGDGQPDEEKPRPANVPPPGSGSENLEQLGPAPELKQSVLSPELGRRIGAIEIGTNSIRLVVAAVHGQTYRVLDDEKVQTRLGHRLHETGLLDPQAIESSLKALERMKAFALALQVRELRAIATCAVREATNGEEFRAKVFESVGLRLRVISPQEEARLAFYSVQQAFDLTGKNLVLADTGGGSTEIVLASGNMIDDIFATQLGSVRVAEMFGVDALTDARYHQMLDWIDDQLDTATKRPNFTPHLLFGSGGTFTSLASMVMASKGQPKANPRGFQITRAEVRHVLERLRKLPSRERVKVPGLSADRADIIVAGVAIVDRLMHHFHVNLVQVHTSGVRDGLLLRMIHRRQNRRLTAAERDRVIEDFATKCGCELTHHRHVAQLAGETYAQLVPHFGLPRDARQVLEAGAKLCDVGYLVDYEDHHKHSYQLIRNSRLAGFTPRQRELIANVARYHRGKSPKKRHENLRELSKEDRRLVAKLAGVLRLAGGLDRSRGQSVKKVEVRFSEEELLLLVHAESYPELDLWDARRRTGLFEDAFGVKVRLEWTGGGAAATEGG